MDSRREIVLGKMRTIYTRKGIDYVREAVEFPLSMYEHGTKKALELGGKNFTDLMRELLTGFVNSMGWGKEDKQIKDSGSLFDRRMSRHIQSAVYRALEEIAQCKMDVDTN